MVACFIAPMTEHDADKLWENAILAAPHTAPRRALLGARRRPDQPLGQYCEERCVIAAFPDKTAAIAMFTDPEYREAAKIREAAATTQMLTVIDGIEYEDLPGAGV